MASTHKPRTSKPVHPIPRASYPPAVPPGRLVPVKPGDSFKSIASENGLGVWDLIYANFQTRNPDEVNWYLENYLGCWEPSEDGNNYRLSPRDRDGAEMKLYVPPKPRTGRSPYTTALLTGAGRSPYTTALLTANYPKERYAMDLYPHLGWRELISNTDYQATCAICMSICLTRCGFSLRTHPYVQMPEPRLAGGILKVRKAWGALQVGDPILIRVGGPELGYGGHYPGMVELLVRQWGTPERYQVQGNQKLDAQHFEGRSGVLVMIHHNPEPMAHIDLLMTTDRGTGLVGNPGYYRALYRFQEAFFWDAAPRPAAEYLIDL
jgi:hypothetical protein